MAAGPVRENVGTKQGTAREAGAPNDCGLDARFFKLQHIATRLHISETF
jgi:hypothetical protein